MTETQTKPEAVDADRKADEGVLAGVLREDKPATDAKPAPVPARRGRRAAPATKTETKPATRTRKAPATAAKPATKTATKTGKSATRKVPATPATKTGKPATKAAANGGASAREANQKLAVELVDLVAGHFKGRSKADQEKIANWLKVLPTGGAAHLRYWPKGFARPTTSDWRPPA